jgi:ABC-2 type transport system permease protein
MMRLRLDNIWRLGLKELYGLAADPVLLLIIFFVFTVAVYSIGEIKFEVENAPIGVVDEDHSELSRRIAAALLPPYFTPAVEIGKDEIDREMASGRLLFVIEIPPRFEQDVLAGRGPTVQINVDATALTQAGNGAAYLQNIITQEAVSYAARREGMQPINEGIVAQPIDLVIRTRFNPNMHTQWFNSIMAIINHITLLVIVLVGAALLREREHGTVEHLLVMPVRPGEIMIAKIWANGLVTVLAAIASLWFVVHELIGVPLAGSLPLFVAGTAVYEISIGALAILLATFTGSMAQYGLLIIPVVTILELMSGAATPMESMPLGWQYAMQFTPTPHFVALAQAVLYRGAGLAIVWPELAALVIFTAVFFGISLMRFRKAITSFQ